MTNEWTPNAPSLKSHFDGKEGQRQAEQGQKPVTKGELARLEAERDNPALKRSYTIGGRVEQRLTEANSANREKQIQYIAERLQSAKGRAKGDFGRSR